MKKPTEDCSQETAECGCCCGSVDKPGPSRREDEPWISGAVNTAAGEVPQVRTSLSFRDHLGTVKARWDINRMNYSVPPGLYAVGNPVPESVVLVSANYKMSFDRLRKQLGDRDAWILVLDTKGINVWCAAGKGTFGTDELLNRIKITDLDKIVSHRRLIVPQLGATGVSAHIVRKTSCFSIIYGPVRVEDLPAFLDAGMKAQPEMRRVRFGLRDRAVLIPVELVGGGKYVLLLAAVFALIAGLSSSGYSFAKVLSAGIINASMVFGAFFCGTLLGPMLLPWLPGRAFSIKGAALGIALVGILAVFGLPGPGLFGSWLHLAAFAFIIPTLTSFTLMNFTGASTFTSLSGVIREMRLAVPVQIAAAGIGVVLWFGGLFINGGR
jgi:acetyl-CoA decarbonylase/synthase complex subunit gamma